MEFDALKPSSEAEYARFVETLVQQAVHDIRSAATPRALESAILAYLANAYRAHLCHEEVTDFFCVSRDSVVDRLGMPEADEQVLLNRFDSIHDRYWAEHGHGDDKASR